MSYRVDVRVKGPEGFDFPGLDLPRDLQDYTELWGELERIKHEDFAQWRAAMRLWSAADLYFLLFFCLSPGRDAFDPYRNEPHFWHPDHLWYAREIQFDSDGKIDVAFRGFGKSTWKTFARNIWTKLSDPDLTSCIFSHTRDHATTHLMRIGNELRTSKMLRTIWSDRFYWDPLRGKVTEWSKSTGLLIKRESNRQEMTFEAHAFVHKLPTGNHYDELHIDDVETEATTGSEAINQNLQEKFVSCQDLTSPGYYLGITGTYYDHAGLLMWLQNDMGYQARVLPGEDLEVRPDDPDEAGPLGGTPRVATREYLFDKIERKGGVKSPDARRSYAMQIACDPVAGESTRLSLSAINYYDENPAEVVEKRRMSIVICVDPSQGGQDPTFLWVWGLTSRKELYWLDGWRARLKPSDRVRRIYDTCVRWNLLGDLRQLRIENYGQAEYADRQQEFHVKQRGLQGVKIIPCNWQGHNQVSSKRDREFSRWETLLSSGSVFFPNRIMSTDEHGESTNLVAYFVEKELRPFPKPRHDDGLDAGALISEPEDRVGKLPWPDEYGRVQDRIERVSRRAEDTTAPGTWMSYTAV